MDDARNVLALLTTSQMAEADRLTIAAGTPEVILMDRAGAAVAVEAERLWRGGPPGDVLVLCGPGNNGGDGFVAASRLRARLVPVRVALLGPMETLKGAAAEAARGWRGPVEPAADAAFGGVTLVVDALFGAGLARPLEGKGAALVRRLNAADLPVLAVDVPSGIEGSSGAMPGEAVQARATVTFFRLKPGHLLLPGRARCGAVTLAEIGIDPAVLGPLGPQTFANDPPLWRGAFPFPALAGHKYTRGHALVLSGSSTTSGAARMSARAALRVGSGLVTLASPSEALAVNAAHQTAVMLKPCDDAAALGEILADARKNAVVLGPGLGVGERTRRLVEVALRPVDAGQPSRSVVLDADALTSFGDDAEALATLCVAAGPVVVTPHDGEFRRLFGDTATAGSRLDRARRGAQRLGTVVVLKGADTVVAAPDGRASIAHADAPYLATAGSGDVLAGLIGGLLAQGMPAFEAASAAVYLHAAAARRFGPGLIAEDLPESLPAVLAALQDTMSQ